MKNRFVILVACLMVTLYVTTPAYGQKDWEKKPYQEWSLKDAFKLLTDSPWAQSSDDFKDSDFFSTKPGGRMSDDPYSSGLAITVRLRSALPIRQAFVRQKQISIKYEKFSAEKKENFDAEVKEFLDCPPCAKYYIVTLDSRFFQMLRKMDPKKNTVDALQSRTFLVNDKGEWRPCVHIREENQELLYFFPRTENQGKPLVSKENKEFYFTMSGKVVEGKVLAGSFDMFEVAKITLNGEIVF